MPMCLHVLVWMITTLMRLFFFQLQDSDDVTFEEREENEEDLDKQKEPTIKTYKNAIIFT